MALPLRPDAPRRVEPGNAPGVPGDVPVRTHRLQHLEPQQALIGVEIEHRWLLQRLHRRRFFTDEVDSQRAFRRIERHLWMRQRLGQVIIVDRFVQGKLGADDPPLRIEQERCIAFTFERGVFIGSFDEAPEESPGVRVIEKSDHGIQLCGSGGNLAQIVSP